MSDLFHERVSEKFINRVWAVMAETPQHQYQILTKRPGRMREYLMRRSESALPNVWLGTSVESSDVKERIDLLRETPASVRFVSFEPLLNSVGSIDLSAIDWAIVGGESGHSARPIKEAWISEIHTQCIDQNTAFFFKQWGAWGADNKKRSKKANGRVYRGKIWDEMPIVVD
jgi:protein gp37